MGRLFIECAFCGRSVARTLLRAHVLTKHGEVPDGVERWPDGGVVVYDEDPWPEDYADYHDTTTTTEQGERMTTPLFQPGRISFTPGAGEVIDQLGSDALAVLVRRHLTGDWGDMDAADKKRNDQAVLDGTRVFSAYGQGPTKLWIITEADRAQTTVLRPDEY